MERFQYHNPTKLLFGKGQLESLRTEIPRYGDRVLLLYGGGSIKANGLHEEVTALLADMNVTVVELSGVEPNPRLTTVQTGIDLVHEHQIDLILAVGGGSVIDCAKGIAAGVKYDGNPWEIVTRQVPVTDALPIGTVLTLAATGSEMNGGAVITNWEAQDKRSFGSPLTYPKFSVLDPTYTLSVPANQTVYGIVDIMSHVFEQYFHASENTLLQERFGESILRTMMETAPRLVENLNDIDARETMLLNGTFALNGTLSMGVKTDWATHMIEHAVSAVYDIPHGGGLAILFPEWLRYVGKTRPERIIQLGERVFSIDVNDKSDDVLVEETVQALQDFWTSIGAPSRLSDYEIDATHLELMAERAMVAEQIGQYVPLRQQDVATILKNAL